MSISVDTTLTGIHSRSENTVKVSRDYDRGRASKESLDLAFQSDSADLVNLQASSGITRISDGQLKWQDFLRPFSDSLSGLKSGADLSRWFDNNSFYRKPSVVKKISPPKDSSFLLNYAEGEALEEVDVADGVVRKLAIPGPYTLASLVNDEYYDSKSALVDAFAKALKRVIKDLAELGYGSIQINEPSLVYRYGVSALTDKKELKAFISAFEDHLGKLPVEVYLHTYFGDCSKILEDLLDLDGVNAVGVDFTQTSLDSIEDVRFGEKSLGCGCIDGRNSLIESPEWIADFCTEAVRTLKPSGLIVLPSSELKYLPRTYADEKIRAIGAAAEILKKTE